MNLLKNGIYILLLTLSFVSCKDKHDDITKPVITLTGDATVTITVGDTYTDAGATATDNKDKDLVVVVGGDTVDASTAGTYAITYNVSDAAGNAADTKTRTVTVQAADTPADDAPEGDTTEGDSTDDQ